MLQELDYEGLTKIPAQPAARLVAMAGGKLNVPLRAPASAPVPVVLRELAEKGAIFDMLYLLAVALPPREAVWWACLATRDLLPTGVVTPCLAAAEAWVFRPDATNRAAVQRAMDGVDIDDNSVYPALAAVYADGTLGPGEMAEHPAPPSAVGGSVLMVNAKSLAAHDAEMAVHGAWLVMRALDIARGGNGQVARPAPPPQMDEDDDAATAATRGGQH